jgi:hypothetical protein
MAPVTSNAIDQSVGHTDQLLATVITSVIVAAGVLWTLAYCRRERVTWPLFVLVSGCATFLCEPLFDHLYGLWFFSDGQWQAVETYGIHVPIWLPIVYIFYYGVWTVWLVLRFRRGASLTQVAVLFLASGVLAGLFETLYIQVFSLYEYQDHQPLAIGNYPVWVAFVNGIPPFLAAIIYVRLIPMLRGWENLALLFVVPVAFAAEFGDGWLYLAVRHGSQDPSMLLLSILGPLTAVLCLGLVLLAARLAGIDRTQVGGSPGTPIERRQPVAV